MIDCSHADRSLVWVPVGTPGISTRQLRWQCRDCFEFVGSSQKHSLATVATAEINPATLLERDRRREERWRGIREGFESRLQEQDAEWWRQYDEYLGTEKWRRLRQLVFRRDGGICQGCFAAPATQVHHLTYKNVGDEFLWQLTSICDECHERCHARA